MKLLLTCIVFGGLLVTIPGCSQRGGSGSSGSADRSVDPERAQERQAPKNVEEGNPPGSHKGGTGPAKGAKGAGTNPGADKNGESASPYDKKQ
jgi:hypothetical protein